MKLSCPGFFGISVGKEWSTARIYHSESELDQATVYLPVVFLPCVLNTSFCPNCLVYTASYSTGYRGWFVKHFNDPSILQKHVWSCDAKFQLHNQLSSYIPPPLTRHGQLRWYKTQKLAIMITINELLESLTVYLCKFTVPVELAVSVRSVL